MSAVACQASGSLYKHVVFPLRSVGPLPTHAATATSDGCDICIFCCSGLLLLVLLQGPAAAASLPLLLLWSAALLLQLWSCSCVLLLMQLLQLMLLLLQPLMLLLALHQQIRHIVLLLPTRRVQTSISHNVYQSKAGRLIPVLHSAGLVHRSMSKTCLNATRKKNVQLPKACNTCSFCISSPLPSAAKCRPHCCQVFLRPLPSASVHQKGFHAKACKLRIVVHHGLNTAQELKSACAACSCPFAVNDWDFALNHSLSNEQCCEQTITVRWALDNLVRPKCNTLVW